jgi:hypothetical protein
MERSLLLFFCTLAWTIPSGVAAQPASSDKKAEATWARGVVSDFLRALTDNPDWKKRPPQAFGLLTPELARRVENDHSWNFMDEIAYHSSQPVAITSEEVAPGGGEVIFRGTLGAKPGMSKIAFLIRVAKDNRDGKWSIRYVTADTLVPAKQRQP